MLLRGLLVAASFAILSHGVTIIPGGEPKPYTGAVGVSSADEFFRLSAGNEFLNNSAEVLMSSFDNAPLSNDDGIHASGDSFIRGAIQAWGEHLHLVIRPEEVWFTILVQMNFYMNAHAEDLRDMFVDHDGQELIYIEDLTWHDVLLRFQDEIQSRVKTDWLLDWLTPNFTTSTADDAMTANILMMGLTKAYFSFEGSIICGLPSVTLLGTQSDWSALLAKLDRLPAFGPDPAAYKARLTPILSRFVASFADPDAPATRAFWRQIVSATPSHVCGAPPYHVSGWIAGFYFWDAEGAPFARGEADGGLALDGVTYPSLDLTRNVPAGYARAPLVMRDFGGEERFQAFVAAGTLGKRIVAGAPEGYGAAMERAAAASGRAVAEGEGGGYEESEHGTLTPLSSWMLYGPVEHDGPEQRWGAEQELADLTAAIRSNFNDTQCAANV